MKKIIIQKARVKNFLSYGNEWQTIDFSEGISLIQGMNVDTGKSNGSGKSSVAEIVPFALFGKTIKDLPQSRIINWNNKKGCAVELYLLIGNDRYIFKRCLKPNKFDVICNEQTIVKTADIRVFQSQIEEMIIGMDFKTFKNLIYFSPNNTISILGVSKDQKRQFLESLFDLSDYSVMLKVVNEKIRKIGNKIKELDLLRETKQSLIKRIQNEIDNFSYIDVDAYDKKINELVFQLNLLKEKKIEGYDDFNTLNILKERLNDLNETYSNISVNIAKTEERICSVTKSIDSLNISDVDKKTKDINDKISDLQSLLRDDSDIDDMIERLSLIKEEYEEKVNQIKNIKELDISDRNERIKVLQYIVSDCDKNIEAFKKKRNNMDSHDTCPMCMSNVDHHIIHSHWDSEILSQEKRKNKSLDEINLLEKDILYLKERCKAIAEDAGLLKEEQSIIKSTVDENQKIIKDIELLNTNLSILPDVNKLIQDKDDMEKELVDLKTNLESFKWQYSMVSEDIPSFKKKIEDIEKKKDEYQKHQQIIALRQQEINSKIEERDNAIKTYKDQKNQVIEKKLEIDTLNSEITESTSNITKNNKLLDHLNYIRVCLKDENVKQFTISTLLPFLNQRVNYYLSESGFPYIIDIDGWLEVTIRGMGTENVSYNSLSGGETKAVDMAVQLACNDIAELQAKTILGINIYDEILDTSLDADGVERIMGIVRVKQQDTGNAVLVISHREEIKDLDFDNHILIEKKNGFSSIR